MKYVNLKSQNIERMPTQPVQTHSKKKMFLLTFVIIGVLVGGLLLWKTTKAAFNPVSIITDVSALNLKETDGRTNILILGSDERTTGSVTSVLTDTLIVASIGRVEGDIVLISIPRDLWVQNPMGGYEKINAIYSVDGLKDGGAENLEEVIENVLGIPLHYYVVVNFNIFKDTVNVLGGINVNIENSFEDYQYPVEGMEDSTCGKSQSEIDKLQDSPLWVIYPCRYEHLVFSAGMQKMDGETALKFARSRHGTNDEGTDFARAKRQQKVILAIKDKALSLNTILNPVKLKELYDTYAENVDTDIDVTAIQNFYTLSQQVQFSNIKSIVLDDRSSAEVGGLLYSPTDNSLYGGRYVLIPRAGDFSQVHAYVQRYLFGQP
ncbi:MAG: putative transcription regulator [uncultured bacterium]|nr:MAG: putative transcription regulator [uncultured bacterium]